VVVRQLAWANKGILAGDDPALDTMNTENDLGMKRDTEKNKFQAKVHDCLEMWEGSQNLHTTQKESRAPDKHMTAVGYISDTEEIIKASCSVFQQNAAAAFKILERSPLPPALSEKDLPWQQTKYFMSPESEDSTGMQWTVIRIAQLTAVRTPKFGQTGMAIWVIQMTAKLIAQQTFNLM